MYVFYLGRGKDTNFVLLPDLPHDRVDGAHHAVDLRVVSIRHHGYFQPTTLQAPYHNFEACKLICQGGLKLDAKIERLLFSQLTFQNSALVPIAKYLSMISLF